MKRGLFITFEGIDGAGKTTQIKLLQEYLISKKQPVRLSREPGGTPIGDKIRALILDKSNTDMCPMTELLLYYASRAQHIERVIAPALAQGECVICDRFYDSSYAYQQLGRGIDKKALDALTSMVAENYRPDITFLLDISPEVSAPVSYTHLDVYKRQCLSCLFPAAFTTQRIALAILPCLPITFPMSSGATFSSTVT